MAKYRTTRFIVTCPNEECEHEFKVNYKPEVPETNKWSHDPSDYDPGQGAEWSPEACPKCKHELQEDDILRGDEV